MRNKKGNLTLYLSFIFLALVFVTVAGLVVPLGSTISTKMYSHGEDLLEKGQEYLADIDDPDVVAQLNASFNGAMSNTQTNIETANDIFKYSWVILLVVVVLGFLVYTRRLTELNYGGIA